MIAAERTKLPPLGSFQWDQPTALPTGQKEKEIMGLYQIPVKKAKGRFVEVDTDSGKMPDHIYEYALQIGLRELVARGASDLKKQDYETESEYAAAAVEIAQKQVELMYAGKTRIVGAKTATKKQGVEYTEAIRLAKIQAREQYKNLAATDKTMPRVSHIPAKQWTEAAKAMVEADRDMWLATARESLARAAVPMTGFDISSMVHADPKLVKKAEEKKAAAKKDKKFPAPVKAKKAPKAPAAHA
jgi:hypothetical protein